MYPFSIQSIERNANMCDDCFVSIDLHRPSEIIGSQQLFFFYKVIVRK